MDTHPNHILATARQLHDHGYVPLPVPGEGKKPVMREWQNFRPNADELAAHFNGTGNIGVLLGAPSGHLTDVDLDRPELLELADRFLPATPVTTGRPSTPRSHRWYIADGAKTVQHKDPVSEEMLVELRSTGAQTLVGPSIHPETGEPYDMLTGDPVVVDAAHLATCVAALAAAIVRNRHPDLPPPRRPGPSSPRRAKTSASPSDDVQVLHRAEAYLDKIPGAISGRGGHSQTYTAAVALVHGFGLSSETALELLLNRYNPRCEPMWSEKELRHKVDDAATKPHEKPRGWLRDATTAVRTDEMVNAGGHPAKNGLVGGSTPDDGDIGPIPLGSTDPAFGRLVLSPKRTLPTARAFVNEFYSHPEGRSVHTFGDQLFEWRDNRYAPVEESALKQKLQPWLHKALRYVRDHRSGGVELAPFESNPITVRAALDSVRAYTHVPSDLPCPRWLDDGEGHLPVLELLPCRSMNVHVPTGAIVPATPALFTFNALPFDYQADPEPPVEWIKFLEQIWGDDLESVELLQEWFGYCLIADTSVQKMLLMVGPRRSGKGTIGRVLTALVGAGNVAGPTTHSLAGTFGLQPLLGKTLALVSDARFSGNAAPIVSERLLCISGEDVLTVDRKYLPSITTKLLTRFMFLTNELPRVSDASTALPGRFLVFRVVKSFYGHEDPQLTTRLLGELRGILVWAVDGLKRLRARGRFVQPKASQDAIQELEDLSSPAGAFVRECCSVGIGKRIEVNRVWERWKELCASEGRDFIGNKQTLGKDLGAAVPGLVRRRGSHNVAFYEGIDLGLESPPL